MTLGVAKVINLNSVYVEACVLTFHFCFTGIGVCRLCSGSTTSTTEVSGNSRLHVFLVEMGKKRKAKNEKESRVLSRWGK